MRSRDLVDVMASFVGIAENPLGSNNTPIGREFGWNGVPWCAETISVACKRLGFPLHEAAVINIERRAKKGDYGMGWTRTPTYASAVCFDFGGRGRPADMHTGLVYQVLNATQFRTIEGNHHDHCDRVLRDMKYVRGFATFPFVEPASTWPPFDPIRGRYSLMPLNTNKPLLTRRTRNDYVKYLQGVLRNKTGVALAVDGDFGEATEKAVINLQRFFHLETDGVVGKATWKVIDYLAGH